jgi:hypothetical protein
VVGIEKDVLGSGLELIQGTSRHLHGETWENHEKSVRIAGLPTEI